MRTLDDAGEVRGKRVFVRVDFNVPVTDGKIDDDYRVRKAMPTIERLRKTGAKIVLGSHIETEGEPTLWPVRELLSSSFPVEFVSDYYPEDISGRVAALPEGGVILLENLRKYPGEKANDPEFAKHIASFADIYVDDAFATAHRKHASMVGVPALIPGYAGLLMADEVRHLSVAFDPPRPFTFIIGGAKFDTKLPLVEKFLVLADTVFVCGALANDLLKARGLPVGRSLLSEGVDVAAVAANPKVVLPQDVVVTDGERSATKGASEVAENETIVDAGPATVESMTERIRESKFVLWNGPLGNFEIGYRAGTEALAKAIAEAGAQSVVGGGDTLSAIQALGVEERFTFVSTGGGAMLDYLGNGTLPAVEALR